MTCREVLYFYLCAALGTIKFQYSTPFWVRCKSIVSFHQGRMHTSWIAFIDKAPLLVILPCRDELFGALVADPHLLLQVDVEIFGDPPPSRHPIIHSVRWLLTVDYSDSIALVVHEP